MRADIRTNGEVIVVDVITGEVMWFTDPVQCCVYLEVPRIEILDACNGYTEKLRNRYFIDWIDKEIG